MAANLYAKSIFGEDALANVSLEKNTQKPESTVTGLLMFLRLITDFKAEFTTKTAEPCPTFGYILLEMWLNFCCINRSHPDPRQVPGHGAQPRRQDQHEPEVQEQEDLCANRQHRRRGRGRRELRRHCRLPLALCTG